MANVLVKGAIIRLTAAADWGWGTSPPAGTANSFDVEINGSGSKLTVGGSKAAVLVSDIITAMDSVTDSYHTMTHGAFSTVAPKVGGVDGTLLKVTLSGLKASEKSSTLSQGVVLDNASGSFTVTATVPAMMALPPPPISSPPVPDPLLMKSGTWKVQQHGQGEEAVFTSA